MWPVQPDGAYRWPAVEQRLAVVVAGQEDEAPQGRCEGGQPVIEELQHLRVIDGLALPETTRRPAPASRRVTRAAGNPLSSNNSESDGVSQLLEAAETLAETS